MAHMELKPPPPPATLPPFSQAPRLMLLLAIGVLGAVTAVDAVTPWEFGFSAFYVLPVLIATWSVGVGRGLVFAFLAAAIGHAVDWSSGHPYGSEFYRVWESFNHLLAYALVAYVTGKLRESFMHEKALREELDRTVVELRALQARLPDQDSR